MKHSPHLVLMAGVLFFGIVMVDSGRTSAAEAAAVAGRVNGDGSDPPLSSCARHPREPPRE